MIVLRWAAFMLAALTLWALTVTPNTNPASLPLVGFFILTFTAVCYTCRPPKPRRH